MPRLEQGCSEVVSEERLVLEPELMWRLPTAEVQAVPKLGPRMVCS